MQADAGAGDPQPANKYWELSHGRDITKAPAFQELTCKEHVNSALGRGKRWAETGEGAPGRGAALNGAERREVAGRPL